MEKESRVPSYIAKFGEEQYLIWSTIVDAPTTDLMTRDEIRAEWLFRYGTHNNIDLTEGWITKADKFGCSSGESIEDLIVCNRAGENEECLSLEEIKASLKPQPPL